MSNIITKAHPVPDMHSTGLRVVGAWLFAIVLILFSTVFVHVPYTREIQMVLAIPVLLFFGAPFYERRTLFIEEDDVIDPNYM